MIYINWRNKMTTFVEANQVIHPVESQWHFPIMAKHGYIPVTKEAIGFVRSYKYINPTTNHSMTATTGPNADYWTDNEGGYGYWGSLDDHLNSLTGH
jgi:hypothetical protein